MFNHKFDSVNNGQPIIRKYLLPNALLLKRQKQPIKHFFLTRPYSAINSCGYFH